jgi:hypothetical protein
MTRRSERGEGNVGCIFWALVLIVVGVFLWEFVPVKVATAQLEDFIVEKATHGRRLTKEKLISEILAKAKELDLPVDRKSLSVEKNKDRVRVRCNYTVPLEYPGYTHMMKVDIDVKRDYIY